MQKEPDDLYGPGWYGGEYYESGRAFHGNEDARRSSTFAMTDKEIGRGIRDALARSAFIPQSADIDIVVCDGVVVLSGFVGSQDARATAEVLVRDVAGVRDIRNEITIGDRGS